MDDALLGIHPDMRLHSEIPLISLLSLVHLGIALLVLVLRRLRRVDDRRIDGGARGDVDVSYCTKVTASATSNSAELHPG